MKKLQKKMHKYQNELAKPPKGNLQNTHKKTLKDLKRLKKLQKPPKTVIKPIKNLQKL